MWPSHTARRFYLAIILFVFMSMSTMSVDQFGTGPCAEARRQGAKNFQGLHESGALKRLDFNIDSLISEQKTLVECDSTNPLGHGTVVTLLMRQKRYQEALDYLDAFNKFFFDPRHYLLLRIALIEELGDSTRAKKLVCEEYDRCHEEFNEGTLKEYLLKTKHYSLTALKAEDRYDCNGVGYDLRNQFINSELESNFHLEQFYLDRLTPDDRLRIIRETQAHRERDSIRYIRTSLKDVDGYFLSKSTLR